MRIVHGGMVPAGLLQISSGFTGAIAGRADTPAGAERGVGITHDRPGETP
jgi:hypothetical protein